MHWGLKYRGAGLSRGEGDHIHKPLDLMDFIQCVYSSFQLSDLFGIAGAVVTVG